MSSFMLGSTALLETLTIRVKNRNNMIQFYQGILGFKLKQEENALAIMGTADSPFEQIWLEESPRAREHFGEVKKLMNYTIEVSEIAELASIYQRALKASHDIAAIDFTPEKIEIRLIDPEQNELILTTPQATAVIETVESLEELGQLETVLSANTRVKALTLNVPNKEEARAFFTDVLGLTGNDLQTTHEKPLALVLEESEEENIITPTHEILGIDFLKFTISEADLLTLEAHLLALNYEFFIDKKKSILTIYDRIGVEWWFTKAKTK